GEGYGTAARVGRRQGRVAAGAGPREPRAPLTRGRHPAGRRGVSARPWGGAKWTRPAFTPRTNTLYVASVDWCGTVRKAQQLEHVVGRNYMGGSFTPDPGDSGHGWPPALDAPAGG